MRQNKMFFKEIRGVSIKELKGPKGPKSTFLHIKNKLFAFKGFCYYEGLG